MAQFGTRYCLDWQNVPPNLCVDHRLFPEGRSVEMDEFLLFPTLLCYTLSPKTSLHSFIAQSEMTLFTIIGHGVNDYIFSTVQLANISLQWNPSIHHRRHTRLHLPHDLPKNRYIYVAPGYCSGKLRGLHPWRPYSHTASPISGLERSQVLGQTYGSRSKAA